MSDDRGRIDGEAPVTGAARSSRAARLSAWVAVLALVGGLAIAPPWARFDDVPPGFAGRLISGDLQRSVDGGWTRVRGGELVPDGASVRSADGATLSLGEGSLSLAGGSLATLGETYILDSGSLLIESPQRMRTAQVGAISADGRGIWRVDAAPVERFGVYDGGIGVGAEGVEGLSAQLLDQVDLLAGRLPARALPLRYSLDDPWDARLLAPAIAADRQVAQLERALAAEYGSDPRDTDFYAAFGPSDVAAALEDHDALDVPAPEGIIYVAVADLLAETRALDPRAAVGRTVGLRRDGATWGLVLQRHGLNPADLLAATGEALAQADETPPPPPPGPPAPTETDAEPDTPTAPPSTPDPPPPPPDPGPEPEPPPPPDDPVDDVVDVVDDTVEELLDLLPLDPPPVDDLVGGVTGTLGDADDG